MYFFSCFFVFNSIHGDQEYSWCQRDPQIKGCVGAGGRRRCGARRLCGGAAGAARWPGRRAGIAASACATGRQPRGLRLERIQDDLRGPSSQKGSTETDFRGMARDELILRWKQCEAYVQAGEGTDLSDGTGRRESGASRSARSKSARGGSSSLATRLATGKRGVQGCAPQTRLKLVQQLGLPS